MWSEAHTLLQVVLTSVSLRANRTVSLSEDSCQTCHNPQKLNGIYRCSQ